MQESYFHYIFVALILGFAAIRIWFLRVAARLRGKAEFKEGWLFTTFRSVAALLIVLSVLAYVLRPGLLSWAIVPLPEWARWIGAIMAAVSLPLLVWIHMALGSNFSTTLHLRESHTLVNQGPYRRVRHPMYSVFYLFFTGVLRLTSNWFIGLIPLLAVTLIVATRVEKEETTMIEKFGDQYRQYMARSGRFLPPLNR